jgi:hypothetical protein
MTILNVMNAPDVFGRFFPGLKNGSWDRWQTFLRCLYGLPLPPDELALFQRSTGRTAPDPRGYNEAFCVAGRRSGKSSIAALIAAYEALLGDWPLKLGLGQAFHIFILATDREQAKNVFHVVKNLMSSFEDEIERETQDEIWLKNGARIAVKAANYRATRGYNVALAILDEFAFFRDEKSANPAEEILTSLLPSLIDGGRILGISTPYGKFGLLYDLYKEHFGVESSDQLIWKAPTSVMNPSYRQGTIDRLLKRDRILFASEYLAEFRSDIESFLPEALIRLYATGAQRPPAPNRRYTCFIDPSGGRQDSFTLAIGHSENEKTHVDLIRETKSPFDPAEVVREYAAVAKQYGIYEVISDRFAGAWLESAFNKQNLLVRLSDLSASELFLEFQARLSSGQVSLIDDPTLIIQLRQLERRTTSGGRDKVGHPEVAGYHDDVANAVAGLVAHAARDEKWTEERIEAGMPRKITRRNRDVAQARRDEKASTLDDDMRAFYSEEGACRPARRKTWPF